MYAQRIRDAGGELFDSQFISGGGARAGKNGRLGEVINGAICCPIERAAMIDQKVGQVFGGGVVEEITELKKKVVFIVIRNSY